MLKKIGEISVITSDPGEVEKASKLILPGVGAFDSGVDKIKSLALWDIINRKVVQEKTPILGICLGAQLMTKNSEEGVKNGFGWVDASTVRFDIPKGSKLKVPNMGWNQVYQEKESQLFVEMFKKPRFYFVHSYHFNFNSPAQVLTTSHYSYNYASSFENDNVLGVQFHPEKSHKFGMQLLRNFAKKY